MKRIKIVLFTLCFLLLIGLTSNNVFAVSKSQLGTSDLIGLGTGRYEIIVSQSTKVDDIIKVLGEPKLVTPSAFGGNAYTFYTDDNFSNYLYIETTLEGRIISFGSIDETYVTRTKCYGDTYDYTDRTPFQGCSFPVSSVIKGGIYYDRYAMFNGSYTSIINYYSENYKANPIKYNKGFSEQSVLLYNALSSKLGKKSNLVFDEKFFYINEQFKEFGTSIREYVRAMGKSTEFMRGLGVKEGIGIATSTYYLLNPMQFASIANSNKGINYDDRCIAIFDYDVERQLLTAIGVKESVFDRVEEVTLTDLEKSRLSAGRYEYAQAISNLNKESAIYDVNPVISPVGGLVAGKLKASKVQGITDYINTIRVGAGLSKLTAGTDEFEVAQHISTLMSYRYQSLGLSIQHQPEKPAGLSDSYYKTAIGWGKGYAENLGYSATQTTVKNMMKYINLFVDDSSETPQYFSHRQKILNANFTTWGYGVSPVMFSNEFSGYKANDVYLEAWPAANGVTFLETLDNQRFQWTAQFTDKYTILTNTTATIKCLNTGDTWNFNTQQHNSTYWYQTYTDSISTLNNKVVMYDSAIIPYQGYVYEVTLHNIKENATGKSVDYSYRSVFEYADENNYPSASLSIRIQDPEDLVKVTDTENTFYLPVGEEHKLYASVDSGAVDNKISWISSNDGVTVTQNGTVYAKRMVDEDVTITVTYDASNITHEIVLKTYNKLEQVKFDHQDLSLSLNESGNLRVIYMPDDTNEVKSIDWYIISASNPDKEYLYTDPAVSQYIKIEPSADKTSAKVTALNCEINNNTYTVMAKVIGISGEYTGTCKLSVQVPINEIRIKNATQGLSLLVGEKKINIDYDKYNNEYFDLSTYIGPDNRTDMSEPTWSVEDGTIISSYDGRGKFKILKEGTTKIIANVANVSDYVTISINVALKNIILDSSKVTKNGNTAEINITGIVSTSTDQIVVTRYPTIDTGKINFSSSNCEIATVDGNGLVTFKAPGTVTIYAQSEENKSISAYITYHVKLLVSDLKDRTPGVGDRKMNAGERQSDFISVFPENTSYKNQLIITLSDPTVVKIENGTIYALKAGRCVVTETMPAAYTANSISPNTTPKDITRSYTIVVLDPIKSVEFPDSITVVKNSTVNLEYTVNPTPTSDTLEIFYSIAEGANCFEVDDNGVVKGTNVGKGVIEAEFRINGKLNAIESRKINVRVLDYIKGDLNKDGKVNSTDAAIALEIFSKGNPTQEQLAIGDMNEDGKINSTDASLILEVFAKK